MPRCVVLALRFLSVLAVLAIIASLAAPAPTSDSPYASALSDLTGLVAFAAPPPGCDNKKCVGPGILKCEHNAGWNCVLFIDKCGGSTC